MINLLKFIKKRVYYQRKNVVIIKYILFYINIYNKKFIQVIKNKNFDLLLILNSNFLIKLINLYILMFYY